MVQIDFSQMPGARPSAGKIDFSQMPKSQANPIATANVLGSPDFQSSNQPQQQKGFNPKMTSDSWYGRAGEALMQFPEGMWNTLAGTGRQAVGLPPANPAQAVTQDLNKGLAKSTGTGIVNLAEATAPYNPYAIVQNKILGAIDPQYEAKLAKETAKVRDYLAPTSELQAGIEPIGKAIPALALTRFMPSVAGAGYSTKMLDFLAKSGIGTTAVTGAMEGRAPTGKELAAYGALDVLLGGLGKVGSNFYRSAFKGTQKQEADTLKRFGKTIGQIAEELKVPAGTARGIAENRAKELPKIWKRLEKVADKTLPAQTKAFKNIANIIASRLTKDLPSSQAKKELSRAVIDKVMFYAPTKQATGREILGIIKNLNKGLFGSGNKSVLNFKQLSSIENKLKGELKNLLPKEAKDIYEDYSKNKLIQDVMSNEAVRKTLGREMQGANTGMQTGALLSGDVGTAFMAGMAGKLATKGATSTALKTYGGKAIKALNSPVAKTLLKTLGIKLSKD